MVIDAFRETIETQTDVEEPNSEAKKFFDMLDAAKHPIYDGCGEGHSRLSAATRMMNIKTEYNLSEDCVDAIADFMKEYLPQPNFSPGSRSLTTNGIARLEESITLLLCNLEILFSPSFFYVMEHLAIHLPREAALGGPVQYRWMYPFERFMFHLKKKVQSSSQRGEVTPTWLEELVGGPLSETLSSPMYCTRGYLFTRKTASNNRQTVNYGVVVHTIDADYYGVIEDILEVEYFGFVNLKCVVFKCKWYDPTSKRGEKLTKAGVTEINTSRKLSKYDPFIIASQADQVCYLPYPRVSQINNPWITVAQINPRGRVDGVKDQDPLQQTSIGVTSVVEQSFADTILVDVENTLLGNIDVGDDSNVGEFSDSSDSSLSNDSSDSELE
ncbi:unnamed protein product [Microthlaspi erraticum]|uniref:DUF4218 domain-containing protein n=1 Tax=Microthlaspi erraticum TaxID=1685480 RepID=A0A6D2JRT0_9BRAS|nr:unnamed protein product [Microthlaspi erraticum]